MPNSSAICISGRPLDCNNAMASRLNSSVKLRRGFVIKHPSCPFPERNKGVHQFGGGSYFTFPQPAEIAQSTLKVGVWNGALGEFLFDYDHVRTALDPEAELYAFLESTYVGAKLAGWDPALLGPGEPSEAGNHDLCRVCEAAGLITHELQLICGGGLAVIAM